MSQSKLALSRWYCLHRLMGDGVFNAGVAIAAAAAVAYPAQAAVLSDWTFDPHTQQLEVLLPEGITPRYFLLAEPARLILDIPNTQVGEGIKERTYSGPVRQIRAAQYDANSIRIVMELAPSTVLDPQQALLQRIDHPGGQNRWVLQPLIAGSAVTASTGSELELADLPQISAGQPLASVSGDRVSTSADSLLAPQTAVDLSRLPSTLSTDTLPPSSDASAWVSVPPLEDNAAAARSSSSVTVASAPPTPSTPNPSSSVVSNGGSDGGAVTEAESIPIPVIPPFLDSADQSSPVASSPSARTAPAPSSTSTAIAAPPPYSEGDGPSPSEAISFGQPLPTISGDHTSPIASPLSPPPDALPLSPEYPADGGGVIIPVGMTLPLQYPNSQPLELGEGPPRQEVLILSEDLRSPQSGVLIAPAGAQVLGRFEMVGTGQKFIVQAISIQGQNLPLAAESEILGGDRQVSGDRMLLNSGIGGVALAILSGFTGIGLLAGAAVAAGTTYAVTPETVIIEPNQIIAVQVIEALPVQSSGFSDSPDALSLFVE
ncbi:MAG: AMIN domain-containing protein [Leptolyngbyaceae cyanobacterium MO_188.B28]|nr:AMIN domain-containing protein [Leptolyngbyaceae cyanobacterium MO_188.B28]